MGSCVTKPARTVPTWPPPHRPRAPFMLKKIAVADLRLGMHLHRFEGAWIEHPFWRVRFVIDDEAVLRKAQSTSLRECWIDTALGLDVADQHIEDQEGVRMADMRRIIWRHAANVQRQRAVVRDVKRGLVPSERVK